MTKVKSSEPLTKSRNMSVKKTSKWIISPFADLSCITLGWAIFFFVPYQMPVYASDFHFLAITFFVAHRYFTFPLVYMDNVEFDRHRVLYILIPILCIGLIALCYYLRIDEPEMFAVWYLFNFFHFVRQKYGILRIYSGKGQWGHKRLDEWATYTWALAGFFYLLSTQAEVEGRLMHYLNVLGIDILYAGILLITLGWMVYQYFSVEGRVKPTWPILLGTVILLILQPNANLMATGSYTIAMVATLVWLVYEWRSPHPLNVPKVLFLLSVVFMYGVAPILSAEAMADATAFSHAAEYIVLVGLAVQNKARTGAQDAPLLSKASNHIVLHTLLFIVIVSGFLFGLKYVSMLAFLIFTYGTSFMHFIFDGMIWKLRRPRVAREVGTATAT